MLHGKILEPVTSVKNHMTKYRGKKIDFDCELTSGHLLVERNSKIALFGVCFFFFLLLIIAEDILEIGTLWSVLGYFCFSKILL